MKRWIERPCGSLCLLMALCALSTVVLFSAEAGDGGEDCEFYTILMRHDGVDARTMERTVAIPLEDELAPIPGLTRLHTVSEFAEVRATVRFGRGAPARYEALRLAAERVHARLPRSAGRPEILFRDEGREASWVAAVRSDPPRKGGETPGDSPGALLEREVKASFRRLPGVGEVETAGTGLSELFIEADAERLASLGLSSAALARELSRSDGLFPAGRIDSGDRDLLLSSDGRLASGLPGVAIPVSGGRSIPLASLAKSRYRERRDGPRSRLNGEEVALVSVIPSSGTDPIALSRALGAEVQRFSARGLRFEILEDRGAELSAARSSVVRAAVSGSLVVALTAFFLLRRQSRSRCRLSLLAAGSVPVVLLLSAASLRLLGFRLDTLLLAALASQIGSALDADFLTLSSLSPARTPGQASSLLRSLIPPLLAGAATSLAVLVPLGGLDGGGSGSPLSSLVAALSSSTLVALFVAFCLLPPLIPLADAPSGTPLPLRPRRSRLVPSRLMLRALARLSLFICRHPAPVLSVALILSFAGAVALSLVPRKGGADGDGRSLFVRLEFGSGTRLEVVDQRLGSWSRALLSSPGLTSIQTTARAASGSALVLFDPALSTRSSIAAMIREHPPEGGFAWIPEADGRERVWEILIAGDEEERCRSLAREAATILSSRPGVMEAVLNFKADSQRILLSPDRERLAALGGSFSSAALELRRALCAPVAWKRLEGGAELDARVGCDPGALANGLWARLPVPLKGGGFEFLSSCAETSRDVAPGSIFRSDRRRVAGLSVRTIAMDSAQARELLMPALEEVTLPDGYTLDFDREALERSARLRLVIVSFIIALVLSYLVLGFISESFTAPLAIIASVPPALALPAIALPLSGIALSVETAAAFVVVSGLAVNASILTVEAARSRRFSPCPRAVWRLCRSRLPVLAATVFTTVAGGLPFVFLREQSNELSRSLALVSTLGVLASFLVALTVIPALFVLFPSLSRPARLAPRGPVGSAQTFPEEKP